MMKVKPVVRNVLLENLLPHHEYELELVSVSLNAMVTNATPVMHFISPSNGNWLIDWMIDLSSLISRLRIETQKFQSRFRCAGRRVLINEIQKIQNY